MSTFITVVVCWNNPQATTKPSARTKKLCDYLYTDKKVARRDFEKAKKVFPTFGWSIDYRLASDESQIAF